MRQTAGWIKLHRKLKDSDLWLSEPFTKGQAWVDLLMMAYYQDREVISDCNTFKTIPRGSFVTSELKLCDRWKWSKVKVRNFLKLLQNGDMIEKKSDRKKTTITIVNYEVYQDSETTERPIKDHRETEQRPNRDRTETEQNTLLKKERRKKERREEGKNNPPYPPCEFFDDKKLDKAFAEFYDFRRRMKAPLSDMDTEKVKQRLCELSMTENGVDTGKAVEIINQSILNGWKGLFPLDRDKKPRASPPKQEMDEWEEIRRKYGGGNDSTGNY